MIKQIVVFINDTNKMPYLHVALISIPNQGLMQAVMLHMITAIIYAGTQLYSVITPSDVFIKG